MPTTARAHGWRDALLALLAYGAITAVLFWPVLRGLATTFPMDLGDPPNEAWLVAWGVHALTTAPSQLLDGNIYYPHANALIYNDNLLGLLPLATPIFLLSGGNTALTYNALYLLSFVLCGLGTFLLARRLTGSVAGAFLAGLIVAYSPYRMVHLSHLNQLSGQWLPFALLFWERARAAADPSGPARLWPELAALGLFFALQALCSIYYAVFLATCLLLYLLLYRRASRLAADATLRAGGGDHRAWHRRRCCCRSCSPTCGCRAGWRTVRGPDQVLYFSARPARLPAHANLQRPLWLDRVRPWRPAPRRPSVPVPRPGGPDLGLAWLAGPPRDPDIRIYGILLVADGDAGAGPSSSSLSPTDSRLTTCRCPTPCSTTMCPASTASATLPAFSTSAPLPGPARCLGLWRRCWSGLRAWRPARRATLVALAVPAPGAG